MSETICNCPACEHEKRAMSAIPPTAYEELSEREAVALYTVLEKFKPLKGRKQPVEPGVYWVSIQGAPAVICEVVPHDFPIKPGLKVSLTNAEELMNCDGCIFFGPLTAPKLKPSHE